MSEGAKVPGHGDSFIVSHFGLDGQREHMIPGNRRRGTPAREKRRYTTEAEARVALQRSVGPDGQVYRCSTCGDWHLASKPRHGDPERPNRPPHTPENAA